MPPDGGPVGLLGPVTYVRGQALVESDGLVDPGTGASPGPGAGHPLCVGFPGGCLGAGEAHGRQSADRAYETAQRLAFSSVTQRIADQIVRLAAPAADGQFQMQITQQALADSVGTVREVAARVLKALRRDGLISVSRGRIHVLDIEGVRRWGSGLPGNLDSRMVPRRD